MRAPILSILLLLLSFSQPAAAKAQALCEPMPGLGATVPLDRLDYLLVGETHGTTELPAAFAAIACAALEGGRPIVVGIEHAPEHQTALDVYMSSEGGPAARQALTAAPAWSTDARFSVAMADMIEQVRTWRAAGADVTVAAFDELARQPGVDAAREESMARRLIEARAARPGSMVVALTGLGHADKEGFISMSPPVASMMMHLPAERSASLAFFRSGGENWRCRREEGATQDTCGPAPLTAREDAVERGVHPTTDPAAFSGRYSPGGVLTASAPARATHAAH